MAVKQLTVFIQNKKGTVAPVAEILSKNNVNLRALSVAETQDFGILRIVVNDNVTAEKVLTENGYLIKSALDYAGINVEYLYAFMARTEKHAYVVLRVEENEEAESILEEAGFKLITQADIEKL